ncbi:MAG: CRISPR-associated helicase Cas3', partial [Planctomycetota bacterium]
MEDHLCAVATLATAHASGLCDGAATWARLAGLWHDLGKYSQAFQEYIRAGRSDASCESARGRVDHSTAGAQHAAATLGDPGRLLAFCIAGHHSGLPDWIDGGGGVAGLDSRLRKRIEPWQDRAPAAFTTPPDDGLPRPGIELADSARGMGFRLAFFARMIFSCLVDADYLATERFLAAGRAERRGVETPPIHSLLRILENHLAGLVSAGSAVGRARRRLQEACRNAAALPPGLFTLTAPTGSGKTLSSLLFALRHADRHGLRRVVYAAPFTTIIEQNARVFRDALSASGPGAVLEHHSAIDPDEREGDPWAKLAAENWDAPLIVTTNVQILESLFASRPGRCRKLHRLARSVLIFDEAQALPVELLSPTLAALDELRENYGCSIVLCTATQPALNRREGFPGGLPQAREITGNENAVASMFRDLERVTVERAGRLVDADLADRLAGEHRVLCVVNTRGHARDLWRTLRDRGVSTALHLSAQMCPAHRSALTKEIRARLASGAPVHVVSTQLVEAGVDLDFPVVYRAMAGLDSIAQAAGRCNREGGPRKGRFVIFETDRASTLAVRQAAESAREALAGGGDPLSRKTVERYFHHHIWKQSDRLDARRVMECFDVSGGTPCLQFKEAAERYRLIRTAQFGVIVPYGDDGGALVDQLKAATAEPPDRSVWRRSQPFTVGVYEEALRGLLGAGVVVPVCAGRLLVLDDPGAYDEALGLRLDA